MLFNLQVKNILKPSFLRRESIFDQLSVIEYLISMHVISEGLFALDDNKRPKVNIVIGLSQYTLQHHNQYWHCSTWCQIKSLTQLATNQNLKIRY